MQAVTISEPRSSLVNILRLPTSYLYREGRSSDVLVMEAASGSRRGNRDGMCWKLNCPVLEIHNGGGGACQLLRIRIRNRGRSLWKSEGFIVPFEPEGQHNPGRGKGPCFVHATKEAKD